jgi:hypothetical protein
MTRESVSNLRFEGGRVAPKLKANNRFGNRVKELASSPSLDGQIQASRRQ